MIQKPLSITYSASPAATVISVVRKAAEIHGKGIRGTVSLPAGSEHIICRTPSSQTPATEPANSRKYSNLSLCWPTT